MLPTLKLFSQVACPDHQPPTKTCSRLPCLFSHDARQTISVPAKRPKASDAAPEAGPSKPPAPVTSVVSKLAQKDGSTKARPGAQRAPLSRDIPSRPTVAGPRSTSRPAASLSAAPLSSDVPHIVVRGAVALHTPASTRQKLLETIHAQFLVLYGSLPNGKNLASRDALAQEAECYASTAAGTYRNSVISVLGRMKKRTVASRHDDVEEVTGTMSQWERKKAEREKLASGYGQLTADKVQKYLLTPEQMVQYDYITAVPEDAGGLRPLAHGEVHPCARCGSEFVVSEIEVPGDDTECSHHWGRLKTERINGAKQRTYLCCRLPLGSPPCSKGRHVFADSGPEAIHSRAAFVETSSLAAPSSRVCIEIAALDCELVYATNGQTLARVTIVAPSAQQTSTRSMRCDTILDEWIRLPPGARVLDLLTRFSGIRQQDIDPEGGKAKLDLDGARKAMAAAGITSETILVGHGLENDLKALRIVHGRCIDTVAIFPHPQGPPLRMSLRALAATHLKKFVQTADPTVGHSSAEDATTALELLRFRMISDT